MPTMSPLDIKAHLSSPHVAQLSTVHPDTRPHLAPIWSKWQGERAYVMCSRKSVKVGNVLLNPAITLSVANDDRPYKYVVIEGTAEVIEGDITRMVHSICDHYEGPKSGQEYSRKLLSQMDIVLNEISVERIISWVDESS